jgi:hypothetical protein
VSREPEKQEVEKLRSSEDWKDSKQLVDSRRQRTADGCELILNLEFGILNL